MANAQFTIRPRRATRRAFTLAEAVVCIAIVGGMMVAALSAAAASRLGQYKICQRQRGMLLAQAMMAEILPLAYEEPVDTATFGPEITETGASRAGFDDVDDYYRWSASPPQNRDGSAAIDQAGWQRTVTVRYVNPDDLTLVAGSDTGVKRIQIDVTHNGVPMASLLAIRTENNQQDDDQ